MHFNKTACRVAAFDIDGTLYERGSMLEQTRNAVIRLQQSGATRSSPSSAIRRMLFRAMGTSITHVGGAGCGQHVKMSNQIAIAGAVKGVAEAVAYAETMGVDPLLMLETIGGGAASSWQLKNLGPKMAAGDFAPGFFIKHFIKDMTIARDEAEARQLELSVLGTVRKMYCELEENGCGEDGTQAIIKKYKD